MKRKLECPICHKEFERYESAIHSEYVFCGSVCSYKARSLGLVKRTVKKKYIMKGSYEIDKIKNCLFCDKEYHHQAKKSKYCSRSCCDKHKKIIQLGDLNHEWKGGSSYRKRGYRGNEWEDIRMEIYKRDNFHCVECGKKCISKKESNKYNSELIIQCHHKDKNKKNNNLNNLETLCLKCHSNKHKFK